MSRRPEQFEPDPVIEAYKRDVDRTLIRENLRLTRDLAVVYRRSDENISRLARALAPHDPYLITGGGSFYDLLPHSIRLRLYGVECFCLGLERLIYVKRAAGRPKDLEALAELETILDEQSGRG